MDDAYTLTPQKWSLSSKVYVMNEQSLLDSDVYMILECDNMQIPLLELPTSGETILIES